MSKEPLAKIKSLPVFDHSAESNVGSMPLWIRQKLGSNKFSETAKVIHSNSLNTVCEQASCPNRGECWSHGTATFMLLGDTCTRACGFCNVMTGKPTWFDKDEPERIATAVKEMGLEYIVLTSVNRDDMPDGGAKIFADTIAALRKNKADIGLELLTPDFNRCQEEAVDIIMSQLNQVKDENAETQMVWGHNVETIPDFYKTVRKGSNYERSLKMLELAVAEEGIEAKSAIMMGMGESEAQVIEVLKDLRSVGVQRIAMGQYLRPTRYHLPVKEYVALEQFEEYGKIAKELGFTWAKSGPMVRSSYHAEEVQ
ncbi:MAG: lipoyl synthase [Woeseiaceae bacterium]